MGERQEQPFQLSFNGRLKVDFQGSRVTSDGGLPLVRELDWLGFGELIERQLTDGRGKNTQLPLADLVRQSDKGRLEPALAALRQYLLEWIFMRGARLNE